jgi:phosphoribosylformylglycinamidine cyclo-ligase
VTRPPDRASDRSSGHLPADGREKGGLGGQVPADGPRGDGHTGAYAAVGVDQEGKNRLLERLGGVIARATTPEVVAGVGPFAGLHRVPSGGGLLAASADGVGTKIKLAVATGRHGGIGWDLVNHCVNDIATAGADPLFFLDYLGSSRLEPAVIEEVITGLADACASAGCALLGGETAEMPDVYAPGDYDLVGFIVGHVRAGFTRDPVREGDVLCALPSSGLHTNGYTLVRRLFEGWELEKPVRELGRPLADELLEPHRSYLEPLRHLRWKAAAHITGGGLPGNLPRALPAGLAAEVHRDSWEFPPIFALLQRLGDLSDEEMVATFNCGLGMILVCEEPLPGLQAVGRVVPAAGSERFRLVP